MKLERVLISVALIAAVLGGATLAAWWMIAHKPVPPQRPAERHIPTVLAPPLQVVTDYSVRIAGFGSVRPKVSLDITTQVAGEVISKADSYISGGRVGAGQTLFAIDPTDYTLARDQAREQIALIAARLGSLEVKESNLAGLLAIEQERIELALADLERTEELIGRGAGTQMEIDRARETVLARRLQVRLIENQLADVGADRNVLAAERAVVVVQRDKAQTDLDRCVFRSPISGRVIEATVEVGDRVQVGHVCGQVYDSSTMEIPVSLQADDLRWLDLPDQPGSGAADAGPVSAEVAWTPGPRAEPIIWRGQVSRIEAGLEARTRTARVVVQVINPPADSAEPILDINMFCRVRIAGRTLAEVFILPRRAILPDGSVWVVRDTEVPDQPDADEPAEADVAEPVEPAEADVADVATPGEPVGELAKVPVTIVRYTDGSAIILPGGGLVAGDRVVLDYVPKPVPGMAVRPVDSYEAPPDTPDAPDDDQPQAEE